MPMSGKSISAYETWGVDIAAAIHKQTNERVRFNMLVR
ncbi:hypothetical protein JCM19235_1181 [Vibrio maritimus]|uniref:Uncharacterized protein n=2 Tax=Vibrio TaxID=662 RepID=A0A090RWJ4_9VIBR|nr:hypothetical protein JCM19235_1181 [Vibrio maritimus]GAL30565.1 hypothetical protein JCM19239_1662 [Vibrio variabilis]